MKLTAGKLRSLIEETLNESAGSLSQLEAFADQHDLWTSTDLEEIAATMDMEGDDLNQMLEDEIGGEGPYRLQAVAFLNDGSGSYAIALIIDDQVYRFGSENHDPSEDPGTLMPTSFDELDSFGDPREWI